MMLRQLKKGGQVTITGTLRNNTGAILSGGTPGSRLVMQNTYK